MDLDKFKIYNVKYKISEIILYIGDKEKFEVPPEMFLNLYIEKDFDNTCFPFCQLKLNIPSWVYRDMQRNSNNLKASFNLKYSLHDEKRRYESPMSTDLSGKFYAIIGDSSLDGTENTQIELEKSQKQYKKGYSTNDLVSIDIMLLNEIYYKGKDVITNKILSSATPLEAITATLNGAGYNNILISRPDNSTAYREFKLLPLNTVKQLKYILDYYMIYKYGGIIFFDLNRGYILSRNPKCDAWITNEYKTVNLLSLVNYHEKTATISGLNIDKKDKCYNIVIPEGTYEFSNLSNSTTVANIKAINTNTAKTTNTKVGDNKGKGSLIYTHTSPIMSSDYFAKSITEQKNILTFTSSSALMCAMTPNKQFNVSFDNLKAKDVNGIYRLSSAVFTFAQAGEYLNLLTVAKLKK